MLSSLREGKRCVEANRAAPEATTVRGSRRESTFPSSLATISLNVRRLCLSADQKYRRQIVWRQMSLLQQPSTDEYAAIGQMLRGSLQIARSDLNDRIDFIEVAPESVHFNIDSR